MPSSARGALVLQSNIRAFLGYKPDVAHKHLVVLILVLCTWTGENFTLPFLQDILGFSAFQFMSQPIKNLFFFQGSSDSWDQVWRLCRDVTSTSKRNVTLIHSYEFPILSQDGKWLIPNWPHNLYTERSFSKTDGTVMLWYAAAPAYGHAGLTVDTSCGLNVQFLDFYFSPWPCFPFPGTKLLWAELWLRILAAVSELSWT